VTGLAWVSLQLRHSKSKLPFGALKEAYFLSSSWTAAAGTKKKPAENSIVLAYCFPFFSLVFIVDFISLVCFCNFLTMVG
jgi:hypothetical protein